jgi:hypothetical protein
VADLKVRRTSRFHRRKLLVRRLLPLWPPRPRALGILVRTELRPDSKSHYKKVVVRGRPRGSKAQETTRRRTIPNDGEPQPPVTNAPEVNQRTSERGRARGRNGSGRGGRGGSTSRIDGILDAMCRNKRVLIVEILGSRTTK